MLEGQAWPRAGSMICWALKLEYDGAPFVGWQRQSNGLSVQEVLEDAAAKLNRGVPVASVVAGRTDAGVHASAQVVQFALQGDIPAAKLRDALNYHMKPHPVVVLDVVPAPAGWNARFSAIGRTYCYRILNRRARPALLAGRVWHVSADLDTEAMHRAAQSLLGRHDFSSFRATACQAKSPLRTLDRLDVLRERSDHQCYRRGAQLPASSGAQHGGHTEAGRGRKLAGGTRCRRAGDAGSGCRRPDRAG